MGVIAIIINGALIDLIGNKATVLIFIVTLEFDISLMNNLIKNGGNVTLSHLGKPLKRLLFEFSSRIARGLNPGLCLILHPKWF
jgi:hypothetical protein